MTLLVILTVVEIVIALGVVVVYLTLISRHLESIAANLGKVAFGVRAIESQTAAIGPAVTWLNAELEAITGALPTLAELAERHAARSNR